jgi:steroid 5-alpha reductase family enzyme
MSPIWQEILPRDGFIILYIVLVLEWSDNLIISYPEKNWSFSAGERFTRVQSKWPAKCKATF